MTQIFLILALVAVIIAAILLLTVGIIRAAGNVSRAEERWERDDPDYRRFVQLQREQERFATTDPDEWDFENHRPRG